MRKVKYSAGYEADHWCTQGHILHGLEGELKVELKDGTEYSFEKGMSIVCGDNCENPHKVISKNGATILIID
jgi:quercetin dioxygenase-like cupin family protein